MSRNHTFKLCSIALLSALSIVFNAYAINLTPDISLSFTYIISFIAGVFLGPIEGFGVGVIGDLIGCIIAPKGPYAPTVTLSSGLLAVLPWTIFTLCKKWPLSLKIVFSFIFTFLVCSVGINTPTWYIMYNSKMDYLVYIISRNAVQLQIVLLNCVLTMIAFKSIANVFAQFGFDYPKKKEEIIENTSPNN